MTNTKTLPADTYISFPTSIGGIDAEQAETVKQKHFFALEPSPCKSRFLVVT